MTEVPLPSTAHPAYYGDRANTIRHWLENSTDHTLRMVVPRRITVARYDQAAPLADVSYGMRIFTRQKAALVHESVHRYWWWVATDDLGRTVAGTWHWARRAE